MTPTPPIHVGAIEITFLLEEGDTGGALTQFAMVVPAGARGPAPHAHAFGEALLGVEGTLTWTVDGRASDVGPGDALFIPGGAVHGFENRGGTAARAITTFTPGGLGPDYFHEVAALVQDGPPDPVAAGELMRRHGVTPA